jgi:hypothetical protein
VTETEVEEEEVQCMLPIDNRPITAQLLSLQQELNLEFETMIKPITLTLFEEKPR